MSTKPEPRPKATPEIEPPPGSPPKRFPGNPEPLAGSSKEDVPEKSAAGKPDDPESPSTRLGSGEDPNVESGTDKNDPEQQAASGEDVEKSFE